MRRYIARWRLEPKDTAAFLRGELVEPVKPIVYYIDPATPEKWLPYLMQGVDDWQVAFEAAGFKNAIIAQGSAHPGGGSRVQPGGRPLLGDPLPGLDVQNASGPHVHDPRSAARSWRVDIQWYHNVMNLLRNWYFIQTAAVEPRGAAGWSSTTR